MQSLALFRQHCSLLDCSTILCAEMVLKWFYRAISLYAQGLERLSHIKVTALIGWLRSSISQVEGNDKCVWFKGVFLEGTGCLMEIHLYLPWSI